MRSLIIPSFAALALALAALAAGTPAASGAAAPAGGQIVGVVTATPEKYLAETVVYLADAPVPSAPTTVVVDQEGKRFVPHVVAIAAGDTVEFQNHDHFDHNVYSPEGDYSLGVWGYGQSRSHTFAEPGVYTQLCSLHPEMLGYVWVGRNRYAATVDDKGRFTIADVPPGSYRLAVWNSHLRAAAQTVKVGAGKQLSVRIAVARK